MPAPEKPIAVIDGAEINNAAFYTLLKEIAGMRVFTQVLDLTLVQRACMQAGIPLSGADWDARVKEEYQRTLDGIQAPGVKDEDKAKILDQVLQQRGMTVPEFRMGLQKNAGLRALAKGKVDVTEEDLKEAYQAKYGEQVSCLIFDVGSLKNASALRDAIEKDKKKPEEAAQAAGIAQPNSLTISKNAHGGGIDLIRDTAFAANRREGELTPTFELNGHTYMMYIVKKMPDRTATTPRSATIDAELKKEVANIKETNWMNEHMMRLRNSANVTINDQVLSEQYTAMVRAMQAQQAAATQGAATAPALPTIPPAATRPAATPAGRTGR
jgi:hypothetical protein